MRVIGVIDLMNGRAVHAVRGERDRYQPVGDGDAVALAKRYVNELGLREVYVADLDAIRGGARQDRALSAICTIGPLVWVDTGVSSVAQATEVVDLGVARVVVGLETLPSYEVLDDVCGTIGGARVAFSLDLRNGAPLGACAAGEPPERAAVRARAAGAGTIIVIDLARVGAGGGLDLDVISRVRAAVPDRLLLAGGGVRGVEDLNPLGQAGGDGVLVATALHRRRFGAPVIEAARHFKVRR
jgi:phosphoribosylformimino-5-aminoimidazole carboxamide ribotide isomerase